MINLSSPLFSFSRSAYHQGTLFFTKIRGYWCSLFTILPASNVLSLPNLGPSCTHSLGHPLLRGFGPARTMRSLTPFFFFRIRVYNKLFDMLSSSGIPLAPLWCPSHGMKLCFGCELSVGQGCLSAIIQSYLATLSAVIKTAPIHSSNPSIPSSRQTTTLITLLSHSPSANPPHFPFPSIFSTSATPYSLPPNFQK